MKDFQVTYSRTWGRLGIIALAVVVIFILGCASKKTNPQAKSVSIQEVAQNALDSTVRLVMQSPDGNSHVIGRGFFVGPGLIVTNFYVMNGVLGDEKMVDSSTKANIQNLTGYAQPVGKDIKYKIQSISSSVEHRLVRVQVAAPGMKPLTLGNSDAAHDGAPVYTMGHSTRPENLFSKGQMIGRSRENSSNFIGGFAAFYNLIIVGPYSYQDNVEWLLLSAQIIREGSGGPVLNDKGEVIGVSSHIGVSGHSNCAISSETLADFLGLNTRFNAGK